MELKLILAIVAGLLYWYGSQQIFYCFLEGFSWLPLMHAVVYGLITGRMTEAIIIGASISALYISLVAAGGNTPADCTAAGSIAIPLALMSNMDVATATALAVSVAVIGNLLQPIQFNIAGIFAHMADRYAAKGDYKGIVRTNFLFIIPVFLLRFPVAFAAVFFGAPFVDTLMNSMPEWLSNGLVVSGGILPALGIAVTLRIINKEQYIPLFLIGYFFVVIFSVSVLMAAIFGVCGVVLYTVLAVENDKESQMAVVSDDDDDDD